VSAADASLVITLAALAGMLAGAVLGIVIRDALKGARLI
jgi:hypothetical protein